MNSESLLNVKCFLLDMDGTFNLGDGLIDGSLYFIDTLRELGRDFLFLTNNSSKHRGLYAQKITRLGLPIPDEKVFTAGEATALYLQREHGSAKVYVVGTPALEDEFRQHGFKLEEDDPQLVVLGFDTTLTYQKLWKLCDFVRAGLPYIATHPDFNCPTETGFMPDIGAMIAFVRASTGREPDLVVGKPNRMIVDAVSQKFGYAIEEMAMVGDRLYTDIALGQTSGITTCLVLSGETHPDDLAESQFQPTYVFDNLGRIADWLKEHAPKG
jgi:4-nitrophenyl phosphatase